MCTAWHEVYPMKREVPLAEPIDSDQVGSEGPHAFACDDISLNGRSGVRAGFLLVLSSRTLSNASTGNEQTLRQRRHQKPSTSVCADFLAPGRLTGCSTMNTIATSQRNVCRESPLLPPSEKAGQDSSPDFTKVCDCEPWNECERYKDYKDFEF